MADATLDLRLPSHLQSTAAVPVVTAVLISYAAKGRTLSWPE